MYAHGGYRTTQWSWFSPSTCMWASGFELKSPGLFSKRLHALSHLTSMLKQILCEVLLNTRKSIQIVTMP